MFNFIVTLSVFNILLLICFKVYFVLTTGINKCSKHQVDKVVIVTGGNAGIGYETAKDLADRGARVIIACRNEGRGTKARDSIISATGNSNVHYQHLDLASFTSIRKFAEGIIKTEKKLDILINNAGVIETRNVLSEDGLSLGMQINHFGPFLLTNLLLPLLKSSAPSRIVNVSSDGYRFGTIDFDNLNLEKETEKSFNFFKMYCNTKLCNVLMTVELARQHKDSSMTVNCLHPGAVQTSIAEEVEKHKPWVRYFRFLSFLTKTAWLGAQTSIYLSVSPEVKSISGCYFSDCREKNTTKKASDAELAKKLWIVSERLVKLK